MQKKLFSFLLLFLFLFGCVEPQPEKKTGAPLDTAQEYYEEGRKLLSNNELDAAMVKFKQSLEMSMASSFKAGTAMNLEMIGFTHMLKNESDKGLEYFLRSLTLYEKLDEKQKIAGILNTIGKIHADKGHFDRAIEFYNNSIKIDQEQKNHAGVGVTLNNIGRVFYEKKQYRNALKYYNKALDILVLVGDSERSRVVLQNIRLVESKLK